MAEGKYKGRILLVDDDEVITTFYDTLLSSAGFVVHVAHELEAAYQCLQQLSFDAVVLDLELGTEQGIDALPVILRSSPMTKVFILTSHGTVDAAVACMRRGATSFLVKGDPPAKILGEIIGHVDEVGGDGASEARGQDLGLVGESDAMADTLAMIEKVSRVDSTVLILGESGTGKELVARAIHRRSARAKEPFNAINCGAIPETLLESELFGHKRGSFTDAKADRKGIFELCSFGTLLLDEIGDMPLALQTKLLRVIQERQVTPIGSCNPVDIQTRVIAATHRDILDEVRGKRFREDLYYRLSVLVLRIPPLRQRREDIPQLTRRFLDQFNQRFGKQVRPPCASLMARMMAHDWPGNVRELQNAIERAVVLTANDELTADNLFQHLGASQPEAQGDDFSQASFGLPLTEAKQCFEKAYMQHVLRVSAGNISAAARLSGRHRADIYRLMHRYGLDKSAERPR